VARVQQETRNEEEWLSSSDLRPLRAVFEVHRFVDNGRGDAAHKNVTDDALGTRRAAR
jgi:hypothetical protein